MKYQVNIATRELRLLLNNPEYKAKAAQISQILQSEDGVRVACDAIEKYLRSSLDVANG